MTTKYINGSYPAGYAIGTGVTLLKIGPSTDIDGTGVGGSAPNPITVDNQGDIDGDGTYSGISLTGGGTVINRPGPTTAAETCGFHGVQISGGVGRIVNLGGKINSSTEISGTISHRYFSAVLEGGGTIVNNQGAEITNGVDISGGAGNVSNHGVIGGQYFFDNSPDGQIVLRTGPSVQLNHGGKVANGSIGEGAILNGGVRIIGGIGTVVNAGLIVGYSEISNGTDTSQDISPSVDLAGGGSVTNQSTGNLLDGVSIAGAGILKNMGQIGAGRHGGGSHYSYLYRNDSVVLGQGTVINGSEKNTAATINDGLVGVQISTGAGRVVNFGAITGVDDEVSTTIGRFSAGVSLLAGGSIINGSSTDHSAMIVGHDCGIFLRDGSGQITNFGSIIETEGPADEDLFDGDSGVIIKGDGRLMNGSRSDTTARIYGVVGVSLYGAGVITNFGSIIGLEDAVDFSNPTDILIEEGSGRLSGAVKGGGGVLVLDGKGGAGTLAGLGATITGFGSIRVAAGAKWQLSGSNSVAAATSFRNDGALIVEAGGSLVVDSGVRGSGTTILRVNSATEIDGTVSSTETFDFTGVNARLTLDSASQFRGAISSLGGGGTDALDLKGFGTGTTISFVANAGNTGGTLSVKDGAREAQITLLGQYVAAGFHEAAGASETIITYVAPPQMVHLAPHV